jgi:hypothetical protein
MYHGMLREVMMCDVLECWHGKGIGHTVTLRMFVRRMMFAPIRANIREHSVREAEDHFVVLVG